MRKYLVLLFLMGALLGLAGCELPAAFYPQSQPDTQPAETIHIHQVTDGQVVRPLSCTTDELTQGLCDCGALAEVVSAVAPGKHNFREGVCRSCGAMLGNQLEFALSEDGKSYIVIGMGSCNTWNLVIPREHAGRPVTAIGPAAFFGQKELVKVEVPEGITSIGQAAFSDTLMLQTVLLPYSLKTIDALAFSECRALKQLYLPAGGKTLGENALLSHGMLESIFVSHANLWYSSVDGVLFNRDKTVLVSYPSGRQADRYTVPDTVTKIGDNAFQRCNLVAVELPKGLETVGNGSFELCRNLQEVYLPSGVKTIGDSAFAYCASLQEVQIPEGVTDVGSAAFSGCNSLQTMVVPDSVTYLGRFAFANCSQLKRLTIGSGVKRLPDSLCARSTSLEVLIVGRVSQIGQRALQDCYSLLQIRFAGNLERWGLVKKAEDWDANVGRFTVQCQDGTISSRPEIPGDTEV